MPFEINNCRIVDNNNNNNDGRRHYKKAQHTLPKINKVKKKLFANHSRKHPKMEKYDNNPEILLNNILTF